MSGVAFEHRIAAHCETGTLQAMLRHHGLDLSEPLLFGLGAGLFFAYLPFRRFSYMSLILRSQPRSILKTVVKRLGLRVKTRRFRDPDQAFQVLDDLLAADTPVTLQVDLFYMSYLPDFMKVHFNAHMINVYGREGDDYLVSDSVWTEPGRIHRDQLRLGRFARGILAPKGFLFYPLSVPPNPVLASGVRKGIRTVCNRMLRIPVGPFGVRGIRRFARAIRRWPIRAGSEDVLAREVPLLAVILEDLGTGGGGFRFLYASFLQEAASLLGNPGLTELADRMRENGDRWRDISLLAARTGRDRLFEADRFEEMARLVEERAAVERTLFRDLRKAI